MAEINVNITEGAELEVEIIGTGPMGPQGPKGDTGPQGPAGATGPQGPTGADYVLTQADKAEIVAAVLAVLPAAEEVTF